MSSFFQLLALIFVLVLSATGADVRVRSYHLLTANGGRVSWSSSNNLIAFDRPGPNGYNIYTMRPEVDPEAQDIRCLTCAGGGGLPASSAGLNKGNPDWHPSGKFLAIQVEKPGGGNQVSQRFTHRFTHPGLGLNNDLWIMDAEGRQFWPVTNVPAGLGGVLHPHFSYSGKKLTWAERVGGKGMGVWVIRVGDFDVAGGKPEVTNIRTITPGRQHDFYETHGFSLDDRKIYFCGNLEPGMRIMDRDIYSYDLTTNELVDLTNSPHETDEHARTMPGTGMLIWMRGRALSPTGGSDYWIMNADGSSKKQLTFFNDPSSPDFRPRHVACADSDWNKDGTKLVGYVIDGGTELTGGTGGIYLFDFDVK